MQLLQLSKPCINAAYIVAGVLFILSLRGLSSQETARRGNLYGVIGMAIAIAAVLDQQRRRSVRSPATPSSTASSTRWCSPRSAAGR